MTTNFTGHESAMSAIDANSMFGTTPVWDRKRKPGRFGGVKSVSQPRATDRVTAAGATITPSTLAAHDPGTTTTISRTRIVKTRGAGGASTLTIAAVIGAVGVLSAAAWFMTRENDGIPELPAASTVPVVAAAPMTPSEPVIVAANSVAPAPFATPVRRAASPPRVRPAASAAATGINASAVLPGAPQSYTSLNPSVTVQPVIPTPPLVVETVPAPPEAIPATPPAADPSTPPT